MLFFIPLHLLAIAGIMYLYAKYEADISTAKICLVFSIPILGYSILWSGVQATAGTGAATLVSIIIFSPVFFLLAWLALKMWFYVGWGKAAAISGTFAGYMVVFFMIFASMMLSKPTDPDKVDEAKVIKPSEAKQKRINEAAERGQEAAKLAEIEAAKLFPTELPAGASITEAGKYYAAKRFFITHDQNGSTIRLKASGPKLHKFKLNLSTSWLIHIESDTSYWVYQGPRHIKNRYRNSYFPAWVEHVTTDGSSLTKVYSIKDSSLLEKLPKSIKTQMDQDILATPPPKKK